MKVKGLDWIYKAFRPKKERVETELAFVREKIKTIKEENTRLLSEARKIAHEAHPGGSPRHRRRIWEKRKVIGKNRILIRHYEAEEKKLTEQLSRAV